MIVLDTSVIVAIAFDEPERQSFEAAIRGDNDVRLSTASYVEASHVLEGRHGAAGRMTLDAIIERLTSVDGLSLVAFDSIQAELARDAFRRFGKGRHPAALNFGDCFAYALAKALDAPLLYKGGDFDKTDLKRA